MCCDFAGTTSRSDSDSLAVCPAFRPTVRSKSNKMTRCLPQANVLWILIYRLTQSNIEIWKSTGHFSYSVIFHIHQKPSDVRIINTSSYIRKFTTRVRKWTHIFFSTTDSRANSWMVRNTSWGTHKLRNAQERNTNYVGTATIYRRYVFKSLVQNKPKSSKCIAQNHLL